VKGEWIQPVPVFRDNWEIKGCPVNGPKAAVMGNTLAVAWFTAVGDMASVKLSFSKDGGAHFEAPIPVQGSEAIGRVDALLLDQDTALVSWMESNNGKAQVMAATVNLATANREMVELSDTFKGVAGNLNGRLDELQPTLANFKTLSDSLKAMEINGTLKKVQETLANLNKTISLLSNGDNTMSKLMTEDSLYVNLNALLLTLDTLADHFNTNPKHFLSPLGKSRSKIERDLRKQEDD
jgi:hypothetical protein